MNLSQMNLNSVDLILSWFANTELNRRTNSFERLKE